MQPQKFYFIRHGETDWNVKLGKMQGHTDIPLNEVGLAQAQGLIAHMSSVPFDQIISSDLSRALKTAQTFSQGQHEILVDRELREVMLGAAEGLTHGEVDTLVGLDFREKWQANRKDNLDLRFPGGESKREVVARIRKSVLRHLDAHPGKTLVFVSHGYAIRSLVYDVANVQANFFVPNCAIVPFIRNAKNEIQYVGPADPLLLVRG